ncbi:MAG: SAM-dependent chlorinase/fluorinase [Planctomycetota bacterium]
MATPRSGLITLLTDFGTADTYVGTMKGVILSIAPQVRLVDLTHEVPPQAVGVAAFLLGSSCRYFPPGTVHVAVVDPGVGSERRVLAVESLGHLFLAPDNGLLTPVLDDAIEIRTVTAKEYFLPKVAAVFHGRDLFAPVAAHVAIGVPLAALGPVAVAPERLERSRRSSATAGILGQVIHVDRFGNLITDVRAEELPVSHPVQVSIEGQVVGPVRRTYSDAADGEPLALISSCGCLEIAVRNGSAARHFAAGRGASVEVC